MRCVTAAGIALVVAACGDNLKGPADAAPTDSPPSGRCQPTPGTDLDLRLVAQMEGTIVLVTAPPGDHARMFAVIEDGRVLILDRAATLEDKMTVRERPFLDISELEGELPFFGYNMSELGLLGLAFHPQFATNGQLFVAYTGYRDDADGPYRDVVLRYTVSATDPDHVDPTSGEIVLSIPDFASNHNAGMLEFGADGYLYISTGDGGSRDDPMENAQDSSQLLGKILRIDIDGGHPYAIPAGNPFANGAGGAPEIWAMGLRNPWRFSFDRATGDLWIGDVGQDATEEVDVVRASDARGANFGWKQYEGSTCLWPPCDPVGKVFPVVERTHAEGWCAVIGGAVYRGDCFPDLVGDYVFADNCITGLTRTHPRGDGSYSFTDYTPWIYGPASIHDVDGELYAGDVWGNVFRVEARRATSSTTESDTDRISQ